MVQISPCLVSIVLLVFLLVACQPVSEETNGGIPIIGDLVDNAEGTQPAAGEVETSACVNIDEDALIQSGNDVYSTRCASCHGAAGEGAGTFPGLMEIESLNAADSVMTLQTFFNPDVHPFIDDITNMDVAAVLSYTRGTFGNDAPVICPEEVDSFRPGP